MRSLSPASEEKVFLFLSVGIVYSLLIWPLLNSLLIVAIFAFWLIFSSKRFPALKSQQMLLVIFSLMYILPLIGITYTSNLNEGLFRLQQKAPLLIFPIIFATTNAFTHNSIKIILTHFVIATFAACTLSLIASLIYYITAGDINAFSMPRLYLFKGGYPYIIGAFCITAISICFSWIRSIGSRRKDYIIIAIVILSVYTLLLSVRVIIACWCLLILVNCFKLVKNTKMRFLLSLVLLVIMVVAVNVVPVLNRQWKELTTLQTDRIPLDKDASLGRSWGGGAIRIAIWESSRELRTRNWLTGVGTGDIQDSLQQAYRDHKFYFASEHNRYNAHNQFLQVLIGHGIGGTIALIISIILPLSIQFIKTKNLLYSSFLFLFGALCFTEVILDINKGVVWYSFFNSIFAFTDSKLSRI